MLSKRGLGLFLDLASSGSIYCSSCSVRHGDKFRLTASCLQLLFMHQPQISLSLARWSFGLFRIPHCSFNRRRESPFHGLACLLRLWDSPSPYGAGLLVEDAQFQALSKSRGYQESTLAICVPFRCCWFSSATGGHSLVHLVHDMVNCRP